MYFLWQRTPYGTLRISYGGICDFIKSFAGFLPRASRYKIILYGLALSKSQEQNVAELTVLVSSVLDLSNDIGYEETESDFERQALKLFPPLGIRPNIVWFSRANPGTEWLETRWTALSSPWLWLVLASCAALAVYSGLDTLFWTAFWGLAAWFTVRLIKFLTKESVQGRQIFSVPETLHHSQ